MLSHADMIKVVRECTKRLDDKRAELAKAVSSEKVTSSKVKLLNREVQELRYELEGVVRDLVNIN